MSKYVKLTNINHTDCCYVFKEGLHIDTDNLSPNPFFFENIESYYMNTLEDVYWIWDVEIPEGVEVKQFDQTFYYAKQFILKQCRKFDFSKLTTRQMLEYVSLYPHNLKFFSNPPLCVQLCAMNHDASVIKYINSPSPEVQFAAVRKCGRLIRYIDEPIFEVQLLAVQKQISAIQFIKNPCHEIQLAAVQHYGRSLQYILNPSREIQIEAIKQNGHAILFVENPCTQMQLIAVKQNGFVLRYIKNPSNEVQFAAVKQNGRAIQFIDNPSTLLQYIAIKADEWNIKFIRNPSIKIQLQAVRKDGSVIQHIVCPSLEVQLAAVHSNKSVIDSMNIDRIMKLIKEMLEINVKAQEEGECGLCFEDISINPIYKLKCSHIYHTSCSVSLQNWILQCWRNKKDATCPLCREIIN